MALGLLLLVSVGKENIYLSSEPEITFFKITHKRHTNFSIETIAQYFGIEGEFQEHKLKQPDGLKDEEKKEFEEADAKEKIRLDEQRNIKRLIYSLSELQGELNHKKTEFGNVIGEIKMYEDKNQNKELFSEIISATDQALHEAGLNFDQISRILSNHLSF